MEGERKRKLGVVVPPQEGILRPQKRLKTNGSLKNSSYLEWSPEDVQEYFDQKNLTSVSLLFKDHNISGRHLQTLSKEELVQIGVRKVGDQKDVLSVIEEIRQKDVAFTEKVFNDPIHGHIEIHPLMVKIVDTPQFQRLRHIKQLGGVYLVFAGASHNRFEHSLGVGYLAGELVEALQKKQPELAISDKDVLCVKIAGLCHDLGHGPFSHLFDNQFIPRARPGISWKHEQASVMMFDYLLESNDLKDEFKKYGLGDLDIQFIREQIAGPIEQETSNDLNQAKWPYKGRSEEKSFLYEIVANKRNGIDVDKWDYFARDCHCLGIPNNFDRKRYMTFARVISVNSRRQICARDKEVGNLYELFHTRTTLHRRAYQHKTAKIIEHMITEALLKADKHLLMQGKTGLVSMSQAIEDPQAYTRLTDNVVQNILSSSDPQLNEAQIILQQVEKRQLYKFIGQTQRKIDGDKDKNVISYDHEIIDSIPPEELGDFTQLTADDIVVHVVTFDYGMKNTDPIERMRFYTKDNPTAAVQVRRDQVSQMLPQIFCEQSIRMYCKRFDQKCIKSARRYFRTWCKKYAHVTPKGHGLPDEMSDTEQDDSFTMYTTPTPQRKNSHEEVRRQYSQSPDAKKALHF